MNYAGMPAGMWMLFRRSFQKQLVETLGLQEQKAKDITQQAKVKYKQIIEYLPTFEKEDRFLMNIVSCAMFSAFCLQIDPGTPVETMTTYYRKAMMTKPMMAFCRMSGKNKFTENDIKNLKETAALEAAERNPYSWNMEFYPYKDHSGYEARFTKCGICTLMKELGIEQWIPAMCHLDYTMSEAGGTSDFVRKYTLASGGPYCDCGYKKKIKV